MAFHRSQDYGLMNFKIRIANISIFFLQCPLRRKSPTNDYRSTDKEKNAMFWIFCRLIVEGKSGRFCSLPIEFQTTINSKIVTTDVMNCDVDGDRVSTKKKKKS